MCANILECNNGRALELLWARRARVATLLCRVSEVVMVFWMRCFKMGSMLLLSIICNNVVVKCRQLVETFVIEAIVMF